MARTVFTLGLAGAFLFQSPQASAVITKVGEEVLAANESARGVDFEWPYAYVSLFTDGIQRKVDVTLPNWPTTVTSFNPDYGDQWGENIVYNGMLVCGHRYGGLNLWDVSVPVELDDTLTNYHYDGLDVLEAPGMALLLYSEHNAGNQPAGIRVYEISGGLLNYMADDLVGNNQRDGRFLTSTSDGWVYQLDFGAGSTRPLNLNVYDLNTNPPNPIFVQMYNMGNTAGNASPLTDLEIDPTERILYAACGFDGLRMLDIGVRNSPTVVNTYSANGFYVRELSFLPGTVYMVVSVRFPNGQWRCRVLNCIVPGSPVAVQNWFGDQDYTIHDIRFVNLPLGPAILVAGQNVNNEATIQVWM